MKQSLMQHPLTFAALACALAACTPSKAPDNAAGSPTTTDKPTAAPAPAASDSTSTRLTVYSGDYESLSAAMAPQAGMPGYALVERPLRFELKSGSNDIRETALPISIDAGAATLRTQAPGVTIEGQRYTTALSGTQDALAHAVGRKVTVEHTSGGAKQTDAGVLVAANDGITLALDDGRVKVIRDYDSFSLINSDDALPTRAALQWTVQANQRGGADFTLAYPMGGMAWRAEYLATLAKGEGCTLALDGAALVVNRTGQTFDNARLSLVAGQPNRAAGMALDRIEVTGSRLQAAGYAAPPPAPPAPPVQRESGEYHAYDLQRPVRLAQGGTERVPLFAARDAVACERSYVVDAGGPDWQPPRPLIAPDYRGETGVLPVTATVTVRNSTEAGLGQPLPAGRARVFDGTDFLGESALPHTAANGELRLQVGTAFDLSAKREATAFRLDRAGRTITESFAVTLRNAKKTDARVRVIEPLPRWSDWSIVASSVPATKKDARHAEFDVPVAAGGETTLTYTVRYRWTQDVNP